jgi:hypothetical protein
MPSITILVTREMWSDTFTLHVPKADGTVYTEELDTDETTEWFRVRGANMKVLEKFMDHVWNFLKGTFTIENYREPKIKNVAIDPKIE